MMRMHRFIVDHFKTYALGTKDEFELNVMLEDDDLPIGDFKYESGALERGISMEKINQFPISIDAIYNEF